MFDKPFLKLILETISRTQSRIYFRVPHLYDTAKALSHFTAFFPEDFWDLFGVNGLSRNSCQEFVSARQ